MKSQLILFVATSMLVAVACAEAPREMRTAQIYEHDSLQRVLRESRAGVLTSRASALAIDNVLKSMQLPPASARSLNKNAFSARIANGVHTAAYPAVAALLHAPQGTFFRMACSATLVGSRTLLTAAHCVAPDRTASHYKVYFQHAGLVTVTQVDHPQDLYRYPAADVALVQLAEEVPGIAPIPLNTMAEIFSGTPGFLVGFGLSASTSADVGIKRLGLTVTSPCGCIPGAIPPCAATDTLVCWDYDVPVGSRRDMSNTCRGDSGGPLFRELQAGGMYDVVGVTSGGATAVCEKANKSFDASIFKYREWIIGAAGADYGTVSSKLPLVGTEDVLVHAEGGELTAKRSRAAYRIKVPQNATLLRLSMNAQDRGNNADAFNISAVFVAAGAADATGGCAVQGDLQFKSCSVASPRSGEWDVMVTRRRGSGLFQLVVTIFTADPANPS